MTAKNTSSLLALGITTLLAAPVMGAELEEIIVTAQKRAQDIQDVGIAITAFNSEQLARLGLTQSTDIARLVPGVSLGGSSGGQTLEYTIRGVAQNDFSDHTESPIAVYIDDTYVVMSQAQKFAAFDLDRLEVLKGPQGTLFGRNATGGLLHFITRRPTRDLNGYLELEYGAYEKMRVEGAVGGPISERVAGRLSGLWMQNDAVLDNDFDPASPVSFFPSQSLIAAGSGEDQGRQVDSALRGQLLFEVNDDVQLWLSANWADSEMSSPPYQTEPTAPVLDAQGRLRNEIRQPRDSTAQAYSFETGAPIFTGVLGPFPRPVPGGDITGYLDPDGREWNHSSANFAFDDLNEVKTKGVSAKLDWQLGGVLLTSISDYKDYRKQLGLDIDSAPMNQTTGFHKSDIWQASEELRLSGETDRLSWVAGLYILHADYDYGVGFKILDNATFLLPPGTLSADYPATIDQQTDNYSLFAQTEFELTDTLTLIAGARIMEEKKDFDYALLVRALPDDPRQAFTGPVIGVFSDLVGLPVPTATTEDSSDTLWAGKLQLDWKPNDDLLLYAGINRGVKAGGFNAPVDFGATQLQPGFRYGYDEEVLLSYEAGFKSTLFGGTTRLNGSVYYYDYSGYQGFLFSGIGGTIVNNDAKVVGGELELITSPTDNLDLTLAVSALDATVYDVEVAPGIKEDKEPAFSPPFQLSAIARYTWPTAIGKFSLQGDVSYSDSTFYSLRNYDSHVLEDYWLANARFDWQSSDGHWGAAALVRNLTDEVYPTMGFGVSLFCGCSEIGVGYPRWWGVQLRRSFD
jgi:iron complex outermembrane receptor protein